MERSAPAEVARSIRIAIGAIALCAAQPLAGQPGPAFELSLPVNLVSAGSDVSVELVLDSSFGLTAEGLSTGICHDPQLLTPLAVTPGLATIALNGGAGAAFFQTEILAGGVTVQILVDVPSTGESYPAAADNQVAVIEYDGNGYIGSATELLLCGTLGTPAVVPVVIATGGFPETPALEDGLVFFLNPGVAVLRVLAPDIGVTGTTMSATIDIGTTLDIHGFTFGLAFDPTALTVSSIEPSGALAALNGGTGPEVLEIEFTSAGVPGATILCVFGTTPPFPALPAALEQQLFEMEITLASGAPPQCIDAIEFSDAVGSPPTPITVFVAPSSTFVPGTIDAQFRRISAPPAPPTGGLTLRADTVIAIPGDPATARVLLDTDVPVSGFSFGVGYSPGDVTLASVEMGAQLLLARCGTGPDFFSSLIWGGSSPGVTVGAVLALSPPFEDRDLLPGSEQELLLLHFDTDTLPMSGGSALQFRSDLGNPPVAIEVSSGAVELLPATADGAVTFDLPFRRGDTNADGAIDIADPVFILGIFFPGPGGPMPLLCHDAADANDDGTLNIADPIAILSSLFGGTFTIPAPNACGVDPTADSLICTTHPACP